MTSVPIRDKDESDAKERPRARGGAGWAATAQGCPVLGEAGRTPEPWRERLADTVILDVVPPEPEGNTFC